MKIHEITPQELLAGIIEMVYRDFECQLPEDINLNDIIQGPLGVKILKTIMLCDNMRGGGLAEEIGKEVLSKLTKEQLLEEDKTTSCTYMIGDKSILAFAMMYHNKIWLEELSGAISKLLPQDLLLPLTSTTAGRPILQDITDARHGNFFTPKQFSYFTPQKILELGLPGLLGEESTRTLSDYYNLSMSNIITAFCLKGAQFNFFCHSIDEPVIESNVGAITAAGFSVIYQPDIYQFIRPDLRSFIDNFFSANFFKIIGVCKNFGEAMVMRSEFQYRPRLPS